MGILGFFRTHRAWAIKNSQGTDTQPVPKQGSIKWRPHEWWNTKCFGSYKEEQVILKFRNVEPDIARYLRWPNFYHLFLTGFICSCPLILFDLSTYGSPGLCYRASCSFQLFFLLLFLNPCFLILSLNCLA